MAQHPIAKTVQGALGNEVEDFAVGNQPLAEANIQPAKKPLTTSEIAQIVGETLERFGAGFQGKEDPVAKRKDRRARVTQEQEKIDLLELANKFKTQKSLLNTFIQAKKAGVDPEAFARLSKGFREVAKSSMTDEDVVEFLSGDNVEITEAILKRAGVGGTVGEITPQIADLFMNDKEFRKQTIAQGRDILGQDAAQEIAELRKQGGKIDTFEEAIGAVPGVKFMTDEDLLGAGIETRVTAQKVQESQEQEEDFTKNALRRALADMGVRDPSKATDQQVIDANKKVLLDKGTLERIKGSAGEQTKEKIRKAKPTSGFIRRITGAQTIGEQEKAGIFVDPDSKEIRELSINEGRVDRVTQTMRTLQAKLQFAPETFFTPGAIASSITSLVDNARNMIRLTGIDPDLFFKNPEFIEDIRSVGVAKNTNESEILGLAVGLATAAGFQGRGITDRKIELFSRRLGAVSGSPEAFFEVLNDLIEEINADFIKQAQAVLLAPKGSIRRKQAEREEFTKGRARLISIKKGKKP